MKDRAIVLEIFLLIVICIIGIIPSAFFFYHPYCLPIYVILILSCLPIPVAIFCGWHIPDIARFLKNERLEDERFGKMSHLSIKEISRKMTFFDYLVPIITFIIIASVSVISRVIFGLSWHELIPACVGSAVGALVVFYTLMIVRFSRAKNRATYR